MNRMLPTIAVWMVILFIGMTGAGCSSPGPAVPSVAVDIAKLHPDSYIDEAGPPLDFPMDVDTAVRVALERNARINLLKKAAEVARSRADTSTDWRDPEFGMLFEKGERSIDRSWLVPKSEIVPSLSYPNRGLFLTTHEEDLGLETDPRVQKVLVESGGEKDYLEKSSRSYSGKIADTEMMRASIRFFPPNPWITRARGATARAAYAAALSDLYKEEWILTCRIKKLFADIIYYREESRRLDDLISTREAFVRATDELASEQALPVIEAMAASQRYIEALSEKDQLESNLQSAISELAVLVGQSVVLDSVDIEQLVPVDKTLDAKAKAALQRRALENRRDISAAYWRSQSTEAILREARAERIPWFKHIEGTYGRAARKDNQSETWEMSGGAAEIDPLYSVPIDEVEEDDWRIEAVITIPLFSLGSRNIRVQKAEYERSLAELGEVTRRAMDEVSLALNTALSTEARSREMTEELAPRIEKTRDLLERMSDQSDLTFGERDRLREMTIELERMLEKSRYERVAALIRLEKVVGTPLVSEVKGSEF